MVKKIDNNIFEDNLMYQLKFYFVSCHNFVSCIIFHTLFQINLKIFILKNFIIYKKINNIKFGANLM